MALHNTPGPALLRYSKGAEVQQPEAAAGEPAGEAAAAAEGDELDSAVVLASDEEEEAAAARQAAADSRHLEEASEQLEASDAAAAEQADSADNFELLKRAARRGVHAPHAWTAELAAAEVAAMAEQQRGTRKPSLVSYLALVHAYAKAHQDESMLQAIRKLLEVGGVEVPWNGMELRGQRAGREAGREAAQGRGRGGLEGACTACSRHGRRRLGLFSQVSAAHAISSSFHAISPLWPRPCESRICLSSAERRPTTAGCPWRLTAWHDPWTPATPPCARWRPGPRRWVHPCGRLGAWAHRHAVEWVFSGQESPA